MFKVSKPVLIGIGAAVLLLLVLMNRSGQASSAGGGCQFTVRADILNVRAEPNVHADAVDTLDQGSKTDAQPTVRNGFRKLDDDRWAANRYLAPTKGTKCANGRR